MVHVEVQQAQAELPRYLEKVAQGETVVVCQDHKPIAEIRRIEPEPPKTPRPMGLAAGMVEVLPGFFDPLPEDVLAAFEGKGQ